MFPVRVIMTSNDLISARQRYWRTQWRRQGFWRPGANVIFFIFVAPSLAETTFFWRPLLLAPWGQLPLPDPPPPSRRATTGRTYVA
jgi:hypothetical protein